ncbi:3-keto-5-aminohexanoate cleavage protein [Aurantimonas sp. MSK8Z-1]|uniref:3-keto-5-aminohexanoate cleavage protein n=1 Tax=Mangrovibrevibacter kandeliae TaxID=2968473 RepID=UPI002118116D|nr:3-keto-5-aminohexanoate cleavage protein [Aurantimonas sp. MSK8Z-1]MCW4115449.1 3-keto-5-aminohexanoate cleavage protein [Aurantimonas sp. MSK8Z-1]
MTHPTIITCAVTGSGLTPSMSPHLPWRPQDIVDQSVGAAEAGAAILHLHARDPKDGRPTNDIGPWREIVTGIRERSDAIVNMSASRGATADERVSAVLELRPEIATVIVGSMNYGRFAKATDQKAGELTHAWERDLLAGADVREVVTSNTFGKIGRMIDILIDADIAMEFECYDVGHLHILDHHLSTRTVRRPLIIQFLTGILGGITSHIDHLVHLRQTVDRLFGRDCAVFTHGTGTGNMRAAISGALMGTHLRVGQEDNLFERDGVLFASNAAQVEKIRRILGDLNFRHAEVSEARRILSLGGAAAA